MRELVSQVGNTNGNNMVSLAATLIALSVGQLAPMSFEDARSAVQACNPELRYLEKSSLGPGLWVPMYVDTPVEADGCKEDDEPP